MVFVEFRRITPRLLPAAAAAAAFQGGELGGGVWVSIAERRLFCDYRFDSNEQWVLLCF